MSGEVPANSYDAGDMRPSPEDEAMLRKGQGLTQFCANLPLTEETTCGIGCLRGPLLQRFANKKAYVILYGVLGCIFSASYNYFNGTITTLEKRFKIPSKTTGIITVGNDISQLLVSVVLSYYTGKGHRPRWIAVGIYTVVAFCLMNALPHFLYGPGNDALFLTEEYGAVIDTNATDAIIERYSRQVLCQKNSALGDKCDQEAGSLAPQLILFSAQLISGVGGSLYYTLGVTYMDDNIKRSKTPALISFSYFIRMLGPAIGYTLASVCLTFYISPSLTPTITDNDPRWLGAWWMGWLVLAAALLVAASLLALFPKTLPRAAARKLYALERSKAGLDCELPDPEMPASFADMMKTFRRLLLNPTLMCNNFAAVFYFMGYTPYWIFMPKYIETQYKQSASFASLITGTVGLVFSAFGILLSGLVITKYKPSARMMAAWNVFVGAVAVIGMISYAFLGCPASDAEGALIADGQLQTTLSCNMDCNCDYVKYTPVCSSNSHTYISPCHAGCLGQHVQPNGTKIFTDCQCIAGDSSPLALSLTPYPTTPPPPTTFVTPGPCPVDCSQMFYMFLGVCCLLKFSGATGRASNFLVSVRCVDEKDKPVAIGLGVMLLSLFAFMPSPIFFGYIIDTTCLVWGKTCTGTGNCWLYNGEALRYIMNFTAAAFVTVGTLFDAGVWYYVKDLKIFDDDETEMKVKHAANNTTKPVANGGDL